MKKKRAFTLAEVLITLGIIGVVAAITIPSLLTNIQNRDLQAQLKKTYSEWNQISMAFMDDNEQSIPDYAAEYGLSAMTNQLPKYLKGVSKFSDWTYKDLDENGSAAGTTPYKIFTMKVARTSMHCDASGFRSDIAGKYILFDDAPKAGYNGPRLCIDLNGDKRPNKLGIDIFNFIFTTDGHVIPEGSDHPDNNYSSSLWAQGGTTKASLVSCNGAETVTCAYYAIHDISPKGNGTYWKDFIGKKQYK